MNAQNPIQRMFNPAMPTMSTRTFQLLLPGLAPLLAAGLTVSARAADVPTHKVAPATLQITVQWDGVFEAKQMKPVKLAPKAWADMTVVDAAAHGSRVEKGDVLVRLDVEKLREQLADLERGQPAAKLALELAEAELANLEKTTPLKVDSARRAQRIATEEYDYFVTISRPQREQSAAFNVKSSEQRLENAQEELKQLEKMYKADDLTEETEEIILKRQRFVVESSQFYLENSRRQAERELQTLLPRDHESLKAKKQEEDLALALAEESLPRNLEKKRQDVDKMRRDQAKAVERLGDLKHDLALFDVRAPVSGIVYYGACENGRWTTGAVISKKLVPGGKLAPNEVFMTVVDPEKLRIKAVVQEADLAKVKAGMKGEATPAAAPSLSLAVSVEDIGLVPLTTGGYEATLAVEPAAGARLVPGMTCKVAFEDVARKGLLAVPKGAVFTENNRKHVLLKTGAGHEKRLVKTGDADDKLIEITDGLKEGDVILLQKPE
jgi:HlyD family secretion protein